MLRLDKEVAERNQSFGERVIGGHATGCPGWSCRKLANASAHDLISSHKRMLRSVHGHRSSSQQANLSLSTTTFSAWLNAELA